jgi:hypothetical protein
MKYYPAPLTKHSLAWDGRPVWMHMSAGRIGLPVEEYAAHVHAGEWWCHPHRGWHAATEFSLRAATGRPKTACRQAEAEYYRARRRMAVR